jgi:hypothetical protein
MGNIYLHTVRRFHAEGYLGRESGATLGQEYQSRRGQKSSIWWGLREQSHEKRVVETI